MTPRLSLRPVLFRLHWALGLTAGLVLAVLGLTGALMSYEEAIIDGLSAGGARVAVSERPVLGPEALAARLAEQRPNLRLGALTLSREPGAAARARLMPDRPGGTRPPSLYLDPYDGTLTGALRGEAAFATIRHLHRFLLIPGEGRGWGRTVTGACLLALVVFLASGLYLRWPKVHRWRIWLKPALARPGRARWWSLHAVAGTWLVPVYLVTVLTGLWWSYDGYRAVATTVLTGRLPQPKAERPAATAAPTSLPLDRAWAAFTEARPDWREATLLMPGVQGGPTVRIRAESPGAVHPGARDEWAYDPATGAPQAHSAYAERPLGQRIADNMLEVHRGRFFGAPVAFLFFLGALAMPFFAATGLTLYVLRRRAGRRRSAAARPAFTRQFLARLGSSAGSR